LPTPASHATTGVAGCDSEDLEMAEPTIRHLLIDASGCTSLLDDPEGLIAAMRAAAEQVGATEVGETGARYVPHGVTAVLFLAESHILVSTWPEHGLALADIQFCNPEMDPAEAWTVLERALGAQSSRMTWVSRGIEIKVSPKAACPSSPQA